jgi:diacylglycerol kinase
MFVFLRGRLPSFKFAFSGFSYMLRTQKNTWIHLAATIAVVGAGFFFQVTPVEWALLIFAIGSVWSAEALNTAIEALTDLCSPNYNSLAKIAKDTAAAAVVFTALAAAIVGLIIFIPYGRNLFK